MSFDIIPAIDLRAGQVVRLRQGDYAQQTSYRVDPLVLAHSYADAGASWLHVVDLDGARSGGLANLRVIEGIAQGLLSVQAGGGVRDDADLKRLFDAGVARVVIGSLAVKEPKRVNEWLARHGADRLCIALDTRCIDGIWRLPSDGWTHTGTATLDDWMDNYAAAGAKHVLCTDIDRDGMASGPNVALYAHLAKRYPDLHIIASGGVRDASDVRAVRATGAAGLVLGRSLLEGSLTLADAFAC